MEVIKITVEEIEIIVTAKVEEALKQINKLKPAMSQVQKYMDSLKSDKALSGIKQIQSAIQSTSKMSKGSKVAVEVSTQDAEKQIQTLSQKVADLKKKIENANIRMSVDTEAQNNIAKDYTGKDLEGTNAEEREFISQDAQFQQLDDEILQLATATEQWNEELALAEEQLRAMENVDLPEPKMTHMDAWNNKKQDFQINQGVNPFESDFGTTKEISIDVNDSKIDTLKKKLNDIKNGKLEVSDEELQKTMAELDKAIAKKRELESGGKGEGGGGFFSGLKNAFGGIGRIFGDFGTKASGVFGSLKGKSGEFANTFKVGMGNVLKYAGALFSLRTIYQALSSSASAWLGSQNAQAQQLSANINYMKYALGSSLAPVIQWITNLVYNLLKAIQTVIYALTGMNIFANAGAKAYKSMAGSASSAGKSAKEASKSLAGVHSEINNIGQDDTGSGGGGGGAGGAMPDFDLSTLDMSKLNPVQSIIDKIKEGDWYGVGAELGNCINNAMDMIPWGTIHQKAREIGDGIADFLNGAIATINWVKVGDTLAQGYNTFLYVGNSFLKKFNFKNAGKALSDGVKGLISGIDWATAGQNFSLGIKGVLDFAIGAVQNFDWSVVVQAIVDWFSNVDWSGIVSKIFELLGSAMASLVNLGMVIGDYIAQAFNGIYQYFQAKVEECGGNIVLGILKGIGDAVIGIAKWIYDNVFKPFIDGFKNAFGIHSPSTVMEEQGNFITDGLLEGVKKIPEKVGEVFNRLKDAIKEKMKEIFDGIKNIWQNVVDTTQQKWNDIKTKVTTGVKGAWDAIVSRFTSIPQWFHDKFSSAWQKVKDVFSSGGAIFDGIKDGILNGLKAVINALISGINRVIKVPFDGINNALNGIRNVSILDMRPFSWLPSISVPQIPTLAKGNVAFGETLAIFGEYAGARSNPEITAPQSIMAETFEDVLSRHENDRPMNIRVQVGAETLFDDMIDYTNERTMSTGQNTIVMVGD